MIRFLLLVFFCLEAQSAAIDVPFRADGGSISYAATGVRNRRGKLKAPPESYELNELNRVLFSETFEQNEQLKKVKLYLIQGEVRLAKVYLSKLAYTQSKFRPIIYRYFGLLAFMEGDYQKSLEYLARPELNGIPHYAKICTLKVLNQIVLSKNRELATDWPRCQVENGSHFNESKIVWLDTLVELKLHPAPGVTSVPFKKVLLQALEVDDVKMILKLALYLNQETLLVNQLNDITPEMLRDSEIRELIGQIYFRTGSLAKAYRYIEDLKSPNVDNIKGNLYLLRNKYELAYAQFKLALEQKLNSQNALERLLPLAWLLGDWEQGTAYAERVIASPQTQINKLTLLAAFLTQNSKFEKARQVLQTISQKSRRGAELEVTQIASFVALMEDDSVTLRREAGLSCGQYDLINCWTLFQTTQWGSFSKAVHREGSLPKSNLWQTLANQSSPNQLNETVLVNQIDIEELDDSLIKLIPKK